jgi:S-adenosylmethionine/arginine decarboxylase-like enzyme
VTITEPATTPALPGRLFGTELLLDLGGCDPAIINDPRRLADYTVQLIKLIDMEAYGDPDVVEFGKGKLRGWTLIQKMTTSNITIHAWPDAAGALINVHSCRPYDTAAATEFTRKYFDVEPDMITATVVPRRVPRKGN